MSPEGAPLAAGSSVVTLGGRQVHLISTPSGQPTVVLLGGCGVPSYVWHDVATRLADLSVIRLDRPGLVETPWPGRLPELSEEVATLAALVETLHTPVLIIAHSMAGPHAEALARQHPHTVAGLVLVDGSVEWETKEPGDGRGWLLAARAVRRAMTVPLLQPIGPLADRAMVSAQSRRRHLFDPIDPLAKAIYRRGDTVASVVAEQAAYAAQIRDLARLRETAPWPGPPTVVLTAAGDGGRSWVADQRRLAELLAGRQIVIDDSRHLMMLDRPDVVADALRSVISTKEADDD